VSGAARTRQERVYGEMRADILGGHLAPGEKLPFAELCKRHDASVGVVREVLSRLVEQGLVVATPQQGFNVVNISMTDLRHLTEARVLVETLTLKQAVGRGALEWESDVLAVHHRLARTPMMDDQDPPRMREEWSAIHAEFHDTLLRGCGNPRLCTIAGSLRDAAELYRRWSVTLVKGAQKRDIPAEHKALMEAVLARDTGLAVRLLTEHIECTTRLLLESQAALEGAVGSDD